MATTLGALVVDLQANTALFLRGMERAENSVNRLERNIKTQFRSINRTIQSFNFLIGGALVTGVANLVGNVTKGIEEIGRFSERIGISIENLSRLQYVAESSGVAIGTMNTALQRQVRRLAEAAAGNTSYQKALTDLKINLNDIINLSPDQQFLLIAEAMQGIASQGERVRLAMQLWDTEGVALLQVVNQGTDAIRAMMEESDSLSRTLNKGAVETAKSFNEAWTRLGSSLKALAQDIILLLGPALIKLADWIRIAVRGLRDFFEWIGLIDRRVDEFSLEGINRQIEETTQRLEQARDILNNLDASGAQGLGREGAARRVSALENELKNLEDRKRTLEESTKDLIRTTDDYTGSVGNQTEKLKQIKSPTDQYIESLDNKLKALQFVRYQVELLLDWYDRLPPAMQVIIDANDELNKELERLTGTVKKVTDTDTKTFAELMIEQLKRVESAFVTFWENVLSGNKNLFDNFKRLAISVLAEIIHEYTTKTIVAKIKTVLEGATGRQQPGGQGGILGTVQGLLGALAGGGIATLIGAGLSSLFGSGDRTKESQLFFGNPRSPVGGGLNINTASPFGRQISFGLHRVGGEGQLSDSEAARVLDTLENASEVMAGIDEILVGSIEQWRLDRVQNALARAPIGSVNYSPEKVATTIRDRYSRVFNAVNTHLGDVFKEFAAGLEGDVLLQFAHDMARINEIFYEGGQIFSDVATAAETINVLMSDFVQEGESMAAVLERINAVNAVLGQVGLPGDTAAASRFNMEVLAGSGGSISDLSNQVDRFFSSWLSDEDNLIRRIGDLGPIVDDLLAGLGTTRDTLYTDFITGIEQGLLSPDQVNMFFDTNDALQELINLEEQLADIRRQGELAVLSDLQNELNATVSSIESLIAVEQQLQAQIDSIVEAIRGAFGKTIEDIKLSILDTEGQYGFLSNMAETLAAGLGDLADPEEIRRRMDRINDYVSRAYGLLTEEQLQEAAPGFISFLESVLGIGEARLSELSEESIMRQNDLEARRETVLSELADAVATAAALNAQSSNTFSGAVANFASAAATPQQINVSITGGLVDA